MVVLTLRILGGFEARLSSGEVAKIPIRKGQALLAFLALKPGEVIARSKLAGLLWGDLGDKQAQANLRQALAVLRKALSPIQDGILRADHQSIGLDGAGVEVDALSFQDLIASGTPADLEAAVSLYRGDLLDGLELSDPGFQAWLEDERRRFHDLMAGALNALVAHKRADGARQEAIFLAQRLLTLDPLREDVHRALMVLYAELGQRQAALQQYQRCRELLASELNVEPEAETEALYRTLRINDTAGDDAAGVPGATAGQQRETDDGETASLDDRSGRPPVATTGVSRGSRRWAHAVGRALMTGGIAALIWLLPWAPSFELSPLDRMPLQRPGELSLAVPPSDNLSGVLEGVTESSRPAPLECMAFAPPGELSLAAPPSDNLSGVLEGVTEFSGPAPLGCMAFALPGELSLAATPSDNLSGVPEGLTESSGPPSLVRMAFALPGELSLAAPSFDDLLGVLERVTGSFTSIVSAETKPNYEERRGADEARLAMQREADGLWPELADSWDHRAVRAFKTRYPEAGQVAEADRRIAFLIQRHREAQAELSRLGYDVGPVDGAWGPRSARAMRAFQSDYGLTPDGVVSEALLDRLKTATPKIATPAIPTPEPQPQPVRPEPEVAVAPPSAQDGIPDDSRWTASGKSHNGSRILATATRRGETLKMMFDVDHRDVATFGGQFILHYTQSCTISVADPVIECWPPRGPGWSPNAIVFGTFPRLTFQMSAFARSGNWFDGDIVLDFRPAPRLAGE